MSDVFDLQDRFTESAVAAIEPQLQIAEIDRLKKKPAASLDAYDLLLRAQQLESECTEESLSAALRYLEGGTCDRSFLRSCHGSGCLLLCRRQHSGLVGRRRGDAREGLRLAVRALELGKDDGNVLWMAAYAVRRLGRDVHRAKELAYRSVAMNPNSAIAMAVAGWMEAELGNSAKALELLRRAQRLSPRDPRGWFIASGMALAHVVDGQFRGRSRLRADRRRSKPTLNNRTSVSGRKFREARGQGEGCQGPTGHAQDRAAPDAREAASATAGHRRARVEQGRGRPAARWIARVAVARYPIAWLIRRPRMQPSITAILGQQRRLTKVHSSSAGPPTCRRNWCTAEICRSVPITELSSRKLFV